MFDNQSNPPTKKISVFSKHVAVAVAVAVHLYVLYAYSGAVSLALVRLMAQQNLLLLTQRERGHI